jgi:PPP family 3-phenylpropionic acid transporter
MEDVNRLGKRLTLSYTLIQCIYIMGYCSVFSFATVFLLSRGFTNSQVGLTLTLASGFGLFSQPVVAAFADRMKNIALRNIIAVMQTLFMVVSLLLLVMPSIVVPTVILFILLVGLFTTQISLVTSLSMEHINTGVPINFSLARGIGSLAFSVLSFFLGFLVDDHGAWVIMLVNVILGVIGIILVVTFRKPEKRATIQAEGEARASGMVEFALKNRRFMGVVASVALLYFSHSFINTYMIQIVQNVGGNNSDMGVATALAGVVELPAMALFPFFYKKIPNAGTLMKISGVFFVLKSLITLAAPSVFWFDVAQFFQFFSYALLLPASVYYVNQVIDAVDQVKGQSYMAMSMGISGMISSYLGGVMLDASGGVPLMLAVGTLGSFVGLLLLMVIDRSRVPQVVPA